ncbi:MAG: tRNA epoxyqueuosine(34) reductase QueG [Thalassolituus sp.]|jgi:epoxyqueuosine reductase|uniref:tRNA epoxyqueuosine(34) reductase QueG n=1 Tax=Thalassolituus sp. TaxID=2030822 RepID=UPI00243C4400|nr:MAG: tRNA epoxyqueuosine(34) reductase QueG [Thalassolituus sp.]
MSKPPSHSNPPSDKPSAPDLTDAQLERLRADIEQWAEEAGFQQCGFSSVDTGEHGARLQQWLDAGYHGDMSYMEDHITERGPMRALPDELLPGTLSVISLRMDYMAPGVEVAQHLADKNNAYISRYALGRDYHKLIRKRLTQLGKRIQGAIGELGFRAFVDSAPILERAIAEQAGLGWIGKNTMLINRRAGSYFFLGEILTDLPLTPNAKLERDRCGRCTSCLEICPTQAFVGPHVLDARRCISYLTIELDGPIPETLRDGIGNRIFGCDDCQIGCPWNRFTKATEEKDFTPRHQLDKATLLELFAWDEDTFLKKTEGMPIRRTGYESWVRNIAVALGNAPKSIEVVEILKHRRGAVSAMVDEHIDWALQKQGSSL